jgi:sugar/nucleoside kinase (ribokinase family)
LSALNNRDPVLSRYVTLQPGESSSYTLVLAPEKVDRIFLHCPCTNNVFGVASVDFSLVAGAKLFHLGYPSILPRLMVDDGAELQAIYRQAKATGVVTSCDTSLPDPQGLAGRVDWSKILRNALPYVDIFVPSIEEIVFMLRRADYEAWHGDVLPHLTADYLADFAAELLDMGAVIAGFKLGEMGIFLQTAHAERLPVWNACQSPSPNGPHTRAYSPAFEVNLVGTTGAGDSAMRGCWRRCSKA